MVVNAEFWAFNAVCCVCYGVSALRSAAASSCTVVCQSMPEARPDTARLGEVEVVAALPMLVKPVLARNEPRFEVLADVTVDINIFYFSFARPAAGTFFNSSHRPVYYENSDGAPAPSENFTC